MKQYLELQKDVMNNGRLKGDRTGTGTRSVFGRQMRFDLTKGFPLVTTKRVKFDNIIHEVLWFLSGKSNIQYLKDNSVKIWDEWATADGELGPIYGVQWRHWPKTEIVEKPLKLSERVAMANSEEVNDLYDRIQYARRGSRYPDYIQDLNQLLDDIGVPRCREERMVTGEIDQIAQVIDQLRHRPDSRRILVSAWNPDDLPDESESPQDNVSVGKMALAPCHTLFQFYTDVLDISERKQAAIAKGFKIDAKDGTSNKELAAFFDQIGIPTRRLSCKLTQRSADVMLGVPYNIAGYALLTHLIAQVVNMTVGEFIWDGGDVHIYNNHVNQIKQQQRRTPMPLPKLRLNPLVENLDDFTFDDIELVGYKSLDPISAPVSV